MDHKPSNPGTDSFVDERMAKLAPAKDWLPDAGRALERLNQRQPLLNSQLNSQWMRFGMTATILGATVFVLALLPWQRLWTSKPAATVTAQASSAAAARQAEQHPEWHQESPGEHLPVPAEPYAPAPFDDTIQVNPQEQNELSQALAEEPKTGIAAAQASPAGRTEPRPLRTVLPQYSDEAREAKIQGTVELVVTVKTDGSVQFESFRKTLGYGLDEKAREAVEQWTFAPATQNGVPAATMVTLSLNFSLR
jgi:TonB family protein